jgi:hypothetical protein
VRPGQMTHVTKNNNADVNFRSRRKHKGTGDRRNYAGVYYTEFLLVLVSYHLFGAPLGFTAQAQSSQ